MAPDLHQFEDSIPAVCLDSPLGQPNTTSSQLSVMWSSGFMYKPSRSPELKFLLMNDELRTPIWGPLSPLQCSVRLFLPPSRVPQASP